MLGFPIQLLIVYEVFLPRPTRERQQWVSFGVTLAELLKFFNTSDSPVPYRGSTFFWPRYILGGVMFGVGMTLASGCGNKSLVRIGGGNIKSIFVVLAAGAIAYLMTRSDFYGIVFHSWMVPISPDLCKLSFSLKKSVNPAEAVDLA